MLTIRCTTDAGNEFVTAAIGTDEDAHQYFMGLNVAYEDDLTGAEFRQTVVNVEVLTCE